MSDSSNVAVVFSGNGQTRTTSGSAVVAAGVGIYVAAALAVAVIGKGEIRYSADTADTIPMWQPWLAAAVVIGLTNQGITGLFSFSGFCGSGIG